MVGKTISHYQILDKLGEGGMGVVYKARDTHLDRFVAIKVLPPERVADLARKRRFVQEAKAASALNHPSIVTIHDIDRADGADFMAMEYVQGKTLGKLIGCKGLSLKNTLHYGVQAADALAKAHAAGIVHRDLKPSNIMITEDGLVKILDFGLAKLTEAGLSGEDQSTRTLRTTTEEGTIVGTVAYMSPEQAEGKPVDVRSDIFSFGTVLYEMLAGHRPFQGDSQLSTLTSILRDSPAPIERARPDVPRELRHIVCRCLEKDREARYASAVELHKELLAFQDTLVPAVSYRALVRNPKWLAAGAMLLTAAVAVSVWLGVRVQRARWARNVALPQIEQLVEKGGTYAAYRLIRQAEKYIPGDPRLQALRQSSSVEVSVRTTPPGAEIYMADGHAAAEGGWELLGMSPVENVRIPGGLIRWRVVKQGFENVEAASAASWPRQFSLLPQGTSPPGMVHVPGGDFVYGSLAPVKLEDYWLDRCEVTNGQFKEFVRAGGYQKREYWRHPFIKGNRALNWEEAMAEFRDTTGRPGPATWELGTYPQGQADFPVGGVSWYEAAAYAEFVGKSLPTLYHWNNAVGIWSLVFPIATLSNMGGAGPARVGSFRSLGAHGTYDQAGNVKEWCWNQVGGNRYILGGAWSDPLYMFAESENLPPLDRSATNGFRCAKYKAPLPETMTAPIQRLVRDFSKEMPVTDEVFQFYRSIYAYDRSDLKAAVEAVDDSSEHWRKEKISFNAAYGNERVIAYLFLPKQASPPYQTVIFFPGAWATRLSSSDDLFVSYLDFIIRSGRAVLHPVYKGTYERRGDTSSRGPNFERDLMIWQSKDLGRSIDYLETRPEIDGKKLAYYGLSMGARLGPVLTAIEGRFKTSVLVAGGMGQAKPLPEMDAVNFAPRARIPVLMLNGRNDYAFPLETSQVPLFRLLGAPEKDKRHVVFDAGHVPPRQLLIKETLDWLDRYLGPVGLK